MSTMANHKTIIKTLVLTLLLIKTGLSFSSSFTVDREDDPFPSGACEDAVAMDCSLREAVIHANNNLGPDLINIPAGNYLLTRLGTNEDAAINGDLDITETVQIIGASMDTTIIDAGGSTGIAERVFQFMDSDNSEISDLTIQGGYSMQTIPDINGLGGGMLSQSNINIMSVKFINNQAIRYGGAGIISNNQSHISDSIFTNNIGQEGIGGLIAFTTDISNSQFLGNSSGLSIGGLVLVQSSLSYSQVIGNSAIDFAGGITLVAGNTVTHSLIENNSAGTNGGGVYFLSTDNIIQTTTINNNVAVLNGGGIYQTSESMPINQISQSTISNNTSENGATVYLDIGDLVFINSTISSNNGDSSVFWLDNSTNATFSQVTYVNNTNMSQINPATLISSGGTITFSNSIVENGCFGNNNHLISGSGNIESPGNTCNFNNQQDLSNVENLMLGPLINNGGETLTHLPDVKSIIVDHVLNVACLNQSVDQRNFSRPNGDRCDAGAVELQDIIFVNGFD